MNDQKVIPVSYKDVSPEPHWKDEMKILSEKIMSTEQVESETNYVYCKVYECGDKVYYNAEGHHHREDGPAVEYSNGDKLWYINDKFHREDGPAIDHTDGDKYWYLNGNLHREDGPALEYSNGNKYWYINDHLHREDGPALELVNGDKSWWLDGKEVTEETVKNLGKMK